ncbi:unnamed protein product [Leptosia nina]|uniref:Uncharacterized protein n=1 Tax=Leptosia nina TaxID=320188 RepID=A0AAV1JZ74_9NEOP
MNAVYQHLMVFETSAASVPRSLAISAHVSATANKTMTDRNSDQGTLSSPHNPECPQQYWTLKGYANF